MDCSTRYSSQGSQWKQRQNEGRLASVDMTLPWTAEMGIPSLLAESRIINRCLRMAWSRSIILLCTKPDTNGLGANSTGEFTVKEGEHMVCRLLVLGPYPRWPWVRRQLLHMNSLPVTSVALPNCGLLHEKSKADICRSREKKRRTHVPQQ